MITHDNPDLIDSLLSLPATALQKVRTTCRYLDFGSRCANLIPTSHGPSTSRASVNDRGTFSLSGEFLSWLSEKKDLDFLERIGGVGFVASALETDAGIGIRGDEEDIRRRVKAFGTNSYPTWHLGFDVSVPSHMYKLVLRVLLLVRVAVKCVLVTTGYYTRGVMDYKSLMASGLPALNLAFDQMYELWLEGLCTRWLLGDQHRMADVIRNGRRKRILISDIVIGDVVFLKAGHRVPADGLLMEGWLMLVCPTAQSGNKWDWRVSCSRKPFLHAGNAVTDGLGTMLVTMVGSGITLDDYMGNIDFQRLERQARSQPEHCARKFGVMGLIVTLLLLVIARNFTRSWRIFMGNGESSRSVLDALAHFYISVPSCWHLIPPVSLTNYVKESLKQRLFLKNSRVIEAMSFAKSICLDITGVLTSNQILVTDFWLGLDTISEDSESLVSPFQVHLSVLDLIIHGLALNTAGSITRQSSESPFQVSGNPMETALLSWAAQNLNANVNRIRRRYSIIDVTLLCTHRLHRVVVGKNNVDGTMHAHCKGDAETILALCSHFYTVDGILRSLNAKERMTFHSIIQAMSAKGLRCIALAHKQVSSIPMYEGKDFSLLGILGIRDQCRLGAKDAIRVFQHAGLHVKVITSDNILNVKAIATECGILSSGDDAIDGAVVEGREFRSYTPEERLEKVDRIKVLVGSTTEDKLLMIKCLKRKGPVMAITGGGIDDPPKEADVGISMYFCGTEFSQQSSDVVVLDNDLASVMDLLRCSRCFYRNFHKLVEFQLTFIISALAVNSICVIVSGAVALTELHLLWAKTIIILLGHTALMAQKPANYIPPMPPRSEAEPLVTNIMWRNVIVQASYQVIVLVFSSYKGERLFGVSEQELEAFLFNIFILCQVFNLFNFKLLDGMNMLDHRMESNKQFFFLLSIVVGIQVGALESANWMPYKEGFSLGSKGWSASMAIVAVSFLFCRIGSYIPVPETPFLYYFGWKWCRRDLQLAESQNPVPETPFMEYLGWRWCQPGIEQAGSQVGDAARQAFSRCKEMMTQMVESPSVRQVREGVAEADCTNEGQHPTDERIV